LASLQKAPQGTKSLWAKVQTSKDLKKSNFDNKFNFIKFGKHWSTYFDAFGKASESATSPQHFVGQFQKQKSYSVLKF